MINDSYEDIISYKRHPFVYLVEAADDICYRIIDMEDAHRIGIVSYPLIIDAFKNVIIEISETKQTAELKKIDAVIQKITDKNEQVSYLRAKCINTLVNKAAEIFIENKDLIISGNWNSSLVDEIEKNSNALKNINTLSINNIYDHHSVIEVEIAGYKVMSELLDTFVTSKLDSESSLNKKILKLIPSQYSNDCSVFEQVLNIVDYIAGMTDGYATEMYRNFKGIEIKRHSV
jgi:dGTPase